jgi:hypothetical protein
MLYKKNTTWNNMSEENKNIEEGLKAEGERLKEEDIPIPEAPPCLKPSTSNLQPSLCNNR